MQPSPGVVSESGLRLPISHSVGFMSETATDGSKLQLPRLQPVYAGYRRDTHTDIDDLPEQLGQELAACLLGGKSIQTHKPQTLSATQTAL